MAVLSMSKQELSRLEVLLRVQVARKIRCLLGAELLGRHRAYPAQLQRAASPKHAKQSTVGTREDAYGDDGARR